MADEGRSADQLRRLRKQLRLLRRQARRDALTNLANRRAMQEYLHAEVARRRRYGRSLAVGLLDVDHFHTINQRFLHPGGDAVLAELAERLRYALRAADRIGRWGGDEFLVLLPEMGRDGAAALADRLRFLVAERPVTYEGQAIAVTVSIGFAVAAAETSATAEGLYRRAAEALAAAKTGGRDRCVVWDVTPDDHGSDR